MSDYEVYATSGDLEAYNLEQGSPYSLPADVSAKSALVVAAQGDIDSVIGDYDGVYESGDASGRKIDPTVDLVYSERLALRRATCAQALYRIEMGPEFFTRPQFGTISGPEFSTDRKAPHVGPLAMRELSGSGLLRNTIALGQRLRSPSWLPFARNIEGD